MAGFSKEQLEFVRLFKVKYQACGGTEELVLNDVRFELAAQDLVVNLVNLFHEFGCQPEEKRERFLEQIVLPLLKRSDASHLSREQFKAALRPSVRERMMFTSIELENRLRGETSYKFPTSLYRDFTENLATLLVGDEQDQIRFVKEEELERYELSFEEALDLAKGSLFTSGQLRAHQVAPGVLLCPTVDSYAVSRLLFAQVAEAIGKQMKGDLIALPINPSTLLFTGTLEQEGHRAFLETAQDLLSDPRPFSPYPLIWNGTQWNRWVPDPGLKEYLGFKKMVQEAIGRDYNEQSHLLREVYQKEGQSIYVSPFSGLQEADSVRSFCLWIPTMPSLLPKTDLIAFIDPALSDGQGVYLAEWNKMNSEAGHLLKPQAMYPKRFLTEQYPTEAIIRKVKLHMEGSSVRTRIQKMIWNLYLDSTKS